MEQQQVSSVFVLRAMQSLLMSQRNGGVSTPLLIRRKGCDVSGYGNGVVPG